MEPIIKQSALDHSPAYASYRSSPYLSLKWSSYFPVYDVLFSRYRGTKCTFVEIGVLNGGSLFMWRDYFGPGARIIGIDLNPEAERWRDEGFEIFIGNQADPSFWRTFFDQVGEVDVVLDDGGHTNEQQIVTTMQCVPHIRDCGLMVVEDTHTSYFRSFGNPSAYSFVNFAKRLIDVLNSRSPGIEVANSHFKDSIFSVQCFESIICFEVDRSKCAMSQEVLNGGESIQAKDFRDDDLSPGLRRLYHGKLGFLRGVPLARETYVKFDRWRRNMKLRHAFPTVFGSRR